MIHHFSAAVLVSLAAACSALAVPAPEDAYDLRGPAPVKGRIVQVVSKSEMKEADYIIGAEKAGKCDITRTCEKEEEILNVSGREVTKVRTRMKLHRTDSKMFIGGAMGGVNTQDRALAGAIILSEKSKAGWKHTLEDGQPNQQQQMELLHFDEPSPEDLLYPANRVKLGHRWKIDAAGMQALFGPKTTDLKGSGEATFLRLEKVGEDLCAVIEIDLDIKATMQDELGRDYTAEMKCKGHHFRSLAHGIDLKRSLSGTATVSSLKEQTPSTYVSGKIVMEDTQTIKNNRR